MIRSLAFLLYLIFPICAYTQYVEQTEFDNYVMNFGVEDLSTDDYNGSPFLDETWKPMSINLNGKIKRYQKARYNLYRDFMEVFMKGERKYIKAEYFHSFQLGFKPTEEQSVYIQQADFRFDNKSLNGFFQVTPVRDYKVLTNYKIKLRKASRENPHLSGTDNKDRLIVTESHFIQVGQNVYRIKKAKDIYKLFPDKSKLLKKFIHKESINVKSNKGIAKLLAVI